MATDDTSKDIVEEVFSRMTNVDDRESALFSGGQEPLPEADDTDGSGFVPPVECVDRAKGSHYKVVTIATAVLILSGLSFFAGRYFLQDSDASTETIPEQQYAKHRETVSQPQTNIVADLEAEVIEAEPAVEIASEGISGLDIEPVINWGYLLSDISARIPTEMHLSVIESVDGSEMVLEGAALAADSISNFVDSLKGNGQIRSVELDGAGIEQADPQGLLTFSIRCSLAPDTEMAGDVDILGLQEAEEFFASIETVCQNSRCQVRSFVMLPEDAVIENSGVTSKGAAVTLVGGYRDILKVVRQLQADRQGVWFDSVVIENVSGGGELECRLGISVYVSDIAG